LEINIFRARLGLTRSAGLRIWGRI